MEIEIFSINDVAKIENEISKSIELYKKATMNESSSSDGNTIIFSLISLRSKKKFQFSFFFSSSPKNKQINKW